MPACRARRTRLIAVIGGTSALLAAAGDARAQTERPRDEPPAVECTGCETDRPAAPEAPDAPDASEAPPPPPEPLTPPRDDPREILAYYAPAPVDAPALRLPEPVTRLYVDAGLARSGDLSALPLIEGTARNLRFALGGSLRLRRFSLDAELPSWQVTTLEVTKVPTIDGQGTPIPQDQHQTALSIGDLRLGATWSRPLPVERLYLVAGAGLRLRVPTHTTIFQFHLVDGSLGQYRFPYYFHIEPTAILGGAIGRFAFVVNQGLLYMTGPDGDFGDQHIIVPNLLFWSAHYAVVWSPVRPVALSADLATDIQLNHVDVLNFEKLNDIVAVSLDVGVQVHVGLYRIDLVGRQGLTHGADLFGVLQYAGTQTVTLRLGRRFN